MYLHISIDAGSIPDVFLAEPRHYSRKDPHLALRHEGSRHICTLFGARGRWLTPQELRGLLIGVLHIIVKVAEFIGIDVHNQHRQAARILRPGQALLIDTHRGRRRLPPGARSTYMPLISVGHCRNCSVIVTGRFSGSPRGLYRAWGTSTRRIYFWPVSTLPGAVFIYNK